MISNELMAEYFAQGYVVLEGVISPSDLERAQISYEETIEAALRSGRAQRDESTGFLQGHRFQNPHHPELMKPALMEALSPPGVMDFLHELCGGDLAMHGIAAFAMNEEFDYRSTWHRDSYFAWGKDSPFERKIREVERMRWTQILVTLRDDESFWFVPGSHNRANTEEEEARFEEERTGWEEMFPGAVQLRVPAGSAVPFDARGIHRGLKLPGVSRRSLFVVYGGVEWALNSVISDWAKEPEYSQSAYLNSLPAVLRGPLLRTIEALRERAGEQAKGEER